MLLEIRGHHLPGRSWGGDGERRDNVHVGIQIVREPRELVPGDAAAASWTIEVEPIVRDGVIDYRGAAVQGRRGDRFVYLTWGDVGADGSFAMFRRAKLMLADIEPFITTAEEKITASIDLTDDRGGPRCARLRPPALQLA